MGGCLDPGQYADTPAYDLLAAASRGEVGLDHRLLHALIDDPARSLGDMLRFGLEKRGEDRVVLEEDLVSIFRHLKTPEALPYFVEAVRRQPHDISDELMEAFSLFPEESSGKLLELYRELGEEEGEEVAFLLASLRVRDERILNLLLSRLESDPGEAAFCLGLYGDPAARPALERLLAGEEAAKLEDWARQSVEEALSDLDLPAPQADHPAFDIWEQYPDEALPQFSILEVPKRLELLSSASAEFRAGAAASFLDEELGDAARDRLIEVARGDSDPSVRARAWEALGSALERPAVREAMLARLTDKSAPVEERCGAMVGLASEADDPAVRHCIVSFYELPDARAKALEAMSRSLDRRFAAFFPPHLDDADPEIRRQAIWGVGYLGIHTESARLRAYFEDEEFREDALFAYALSVPAQISRGRAKALLRKVANDAGGLSLAEGELVEWAIDERLALHGLEPVFKFETEADVEPVPESEPPAKAGRNDPCPCGSGKKYKKCCGA